MRSSCATRRATNARCGTRRRIRSAGPRISTARSYQKLDIEDDDDQALSQTITAAGSRRCSTTSSRRSCRRRRRPTSTSCASKDMDYLLRVVGPAHAVPPGGSAEFSETLFVGPKLQEQLKAAGPRLELTADYGMLDDPRAAAVLAAVEDLRIRRQLGLDDHHRDLPDQARLLQAGRDERPLDGEDEDRRAAAQGACRSATRTTAKARRAR